MGGKRRKFIYLFFSFLLQPPLLSDMPSYATQETRRNHEERRRLFQELQNHIPLDRFKDGLKKGDASMKERLVAQKTRELSKRFKKDRHTTPSHCAPRTTHSG